MKVYRSNSEDKPKRKLGKKGFLTIGITAALLVAAVAVTLTLALGGGSPVVPIDSPPVATKPSWVMPVDQVEIGKTFSKDVLVKYKTSGFWQTHEGVDFLADKGTPVKAVSKGTVLSIDLNTTVEGTVIKIQHDSGVVSVYKGLNDSVTVEVGDNVEAGDVIGAVGSMSLESREYSKAHLHLEITKDGKRVNPMDYLPELGDK